MSRLLRCAAIGSVVILLLVFAAYPQGAGDLVGVLQDMRKTLNEFNSRLGHLEQLVKELAKKEKKDPSGRERAAGTAPPATPAASPVAAAQDAYQRGRAAEDRGNYEPAIEAYSKAVELDPRNDSAFLHRAYSYFHLGRVDLALKDASQSLKIQPENSKAYEFRSRVYRALKDYTHAIDDLDEALKRDFNPDFLLAEASLEEERGDFKTAIDLYGNALAHQPAPAIYLKRASAYKQMNDTDRALADCAAALAAKPPLPEAYLCRADSYVRKGMLPLAVADLNEALRLKPSLPEAGSMIKAVRELVALNEEVKKVMTPPTLSAITTTAKPEEPTTAAAQPPSTAAAPPPPAAAAPPSTTASAQPSVTASAQPSVTAPAQPSVTAPAPRPLAAAAPPPAAAAARSASTATVPTTLQDPAKEAQRLTSVGRANTMQGKFEDAIDTLTRAIEASPSSPVAYNSRGYAYLRSRKYQQALNDFTTAIRLAPNYANAYWNLGVTLRLMGDREAGMKDMQKAAELEKAYSSVLNRKPSQ